MSAEQIYLVEMTGANAAAPLAARIADANAWPAGRPEGTT